mmetsp:Transcript_103336/g.267257  ORF Transcript_103336/g.267257 Transcript_103336/m.267257 type:complete len:373 (-) Transcript_103336:927-2045(-)
MVLLDQRCQALEGRLHPSFLQLGRVCKEGQSMEHAAQISWRIAEERSCQLLRLALPQRWKETLERVSSQLRRHDIVGVPMCKERRKSTQLYLRLRSRLRHRLHLRSAEVEPLHAGRRQELTICDLCTNIRSSALEELRPSNVTAHIAQRVAEDAVGDDARALCIVLPAPPPELFPLGADQPECMLLDVGFVFPRVLLDEVSHLDGSGRRQVCRILRGVLSLVHVVLDDRKPDSPQRRRRRRRAAAASGMLVDLAPDHRTGTAVVQHSAVARCAEERQQARAMLELEATAALGHPVRPDADRQAGLIKEAVGDVLAKRHCHATAARWSRAGAVVRVGPLRIEEDLLILSPLLTSGKLLVGQRIRIVALPRRFG